MLTPIRLAFVAAAALACTAPAAACPLCDTATGERVRAATLSADFGANLLLVLLPFPVLAALVALVHFGLPAAPSERTEAPDSNPGA
ncbi:hypothetical protein [Gemmata sp.]|uniref:hypothetical protein n=1 Tax=Gemmata sp. TaxID=1914242 RepID=UPI003F72EFC2